MGLLQAAIGSASGVLSDQWKEFFYCDALDKDVLVVKGKKRVSSHSSNRGSDNIITKGSGIAVADGQCMIIVEQGKVVEVCAEPGEYTYDSSTEPSIFCGNLGDGIMETFKQIGKRFTYGGEAPKDQRIYYFNTKEITDNKFGTANPIMFRIVDDRINLDLDASVRCNGMYSYKITDPILFYTNVCGNVAGSYTRSEIDQQLKTEFISALQPAFAQLSAKKMRPNEIPAHTDDLCEAMNSVLTKKWSELRGISIVSIAMNPITLPEDYQKMIADAQRAAMLKDPTMAAATMLNAKADAMRDAANNSAGAMTGFMGMNMAGAQGGDIDIQGLYAMGNKKEETTQANMKVNDKPTWTCECGTLNTGKFCAECGKPKPADADGWTCECGTVNKGKFCSECGKPKPASAPKYVCDKCGWEPEDPFNPPKFCPECGDPFDEKDRR
ncbi:MAG: SPFH domain-containing protein [Faecalicoccus sp.]|nr:SPFH domain-containing protein [Faecalicoccus sp.]